MSLIFRDQRIENLEDDVEYIKSLIDQSTAGLQAEVDALQINDAAQDLTLTNHETRIQTLEADNPEALRTLTDVQVTIAPTEDGKFLKYDSTTDKFILGTSSLANLSDIDFTPAPVSGDVLKYDGISWYPSVENPFPEVVDNQNYV